MLARLLAALLLVIARGGACSMFYPIVHVGPNFRVRVEDRGRPVEGLPLVIDGNRVLTDSNGVAVFRGIRPGSHRVSADHDAGVPDGADLEVKLDGQPMLLCP